MKLEMLLSNIIAYPIHVSRFSFHTDMNVISFIIGQDLGQNHCFREQFDVAVARAVAEMRILGNHKTQLYWFSLCIL